MSGMEFLSVALTAAGAISTLAAAGNWLVKLIAVFKAPNAEQDRRLAQLERHMEEVDEFLAKDKKRLDNMDESNRVTQRALLALLAHGIDLRDLKRGSDWSCGPLQFSERTRPGTQTSRCPLSPLLIL